MGKHRSTPEAEPLAALMARIQPPTFDSDADTDTFDAIPAFRPPIRSRLTPWAAGAAVAGVVVTGVAVAPHVTLDPPSAAPVSREADLPTGKAASPALAAERLADLAASRAAREANEAAAVQIQVAAEESAHASQEAAAEAARQEEAAAASEAVTEPVVTADDPTESASPAAASGPAAEVAVATAMAQLGKPYVWGAEGPSSFDCSGLMLYAYDAAGINLPRVSRDQAQAGVAVSRAELQPGDLVAFYSPVTHIAMYIGNGQVVHAPEPGDVVKVTDIDAFGSITAMRRVA